MRLQASLESGLKLVAKTGFLQRSDCSAFAEICVRPDLGGTRFYYGLSANWQIGDYFKLYSRIGREESHHYTREYDLSVGLRYAF